MGAVFRYAIAPTLRCVMRYAAPRARINPWSRWTGRAPAIMYGAPSRAAFRQYLDGPSTVHPGSLDEIESWLRACVTKSDSEPWAAGHWRTAARDFEQARSGNCLDHSLWAWRKLNELGYHTELVVGWLGKPYDSGANRHAWLLVQHAGTTLLLEPSRKEGTMVHPLDDVREAYTPEHGVMPNADMFNFDGAVLSGLASLELMRESSSASGTT